MAEEVENTEDQDGTENLKVLENIDVLLTVEVGRTEITIRDLCCLPPRPHETVHLVHGPQGETTHAPGHADNPLHVACCIMCPQLLPPNAARRSVRRQRTLLPWSPPHDL